MDADEDAATIAWAFEASSGEAGTRALEALAERLAWADAIPLCDAEAARCSIQRRSTAAREMMSGLMCVPTPSTPLPKLALFVLLAARGYVVLYAETLERKSRQLRSQAVSRNNEAGVAADQALRAGVQATMRAWARDLVPLLLHTVLPQLQLRDAAPTTVSATHPLNGTARPEVRGEETSTTTGKPEDGDAQGLLAVLQTYGVRGALVRLVEAVHRTTTTNTTTPTDTAEATAVLLATYAMLCSSELCRTVSGASVLGRWRTRVLAEMGGGPSRNSPAVRHAPATASGECGTTASSSDVATCLARLSDVASEAHGSALSYAMGALYTGGSGAGSRGSAAGALHGAHVERGSGPSAGTAASLAMQHERDVDACTLVAADALDEDAAPHAGLSDALVALPICREGALLLLADALRAPGTTACAYSVSAVTMLLSVLDGFAAALLCASSAAGLLRLLLLLCDIVAAVSKYSVPCAGEARGDAVLGEDPAHAFDHCLTRRYEAFFDVAKELLTVSAMCPLEEHRRLARVAAASLLERLEETARIRMQVSLLTLCPYPSIARFFLEQLLRDWRDAQLPAEDPDSGVAVRESPIQVLLPPALAQCARAFLTQISSGVGGFVDPLVVTLNFVRVEVSRRTWIAAAARQPRPAASPDAVAQAWRELLHLTREHILPQCHAITTSTSANDSNGVAGSAAATFAVAPSLSPLDIFSLSCAVEGLETVLG